MVIGRVIAHFASIPITPRRSPARSALQQAGILHHLDAVEARAQRGGVGVLAAQAAADAAAR
jgi:hypothetical protein